MQINIALNNNSDVQAETIRRRWFKTTTSQQTRDSFIFNECIDRFDGNPEDLIPYMGKDEESIVTRRLTIKSTSLDRMKTIASGLQKPLAATYRAIISYTIDKLSATEDEETAVSPVSVSKLLIEKIAQLEKQMETCCQTMKEIKELTRE